MELTTQRMWRLCRPSGETLQLVFIVVARSLRLPAQPNPTPAIDETTKDSPEEEDGTHPEDPSRAP